ncbi:MAG: hypothetical protein EAZ51_01160 [Sphingobacteriales bacterium]|nr:MAG: hypothetical protein EAZ64_01690 [Sphingobacteriales bacterium]TAF83160.1 MAG: hypothetical protein EAZ51_01160 [Sphingobacteriales bacterium]
MKKLTFTLFVVSALLTLTISHANAQNYKNAIGGRFGNANGVSFKTGLKNNAMLELIGNFRSNDNFSYANLTALYEVYNPIKGAAGLTWYYGGGGSIGSAKAKGFKGDVYLGLNGVLGLDYKFKDAPINLSLDWIPTFQISPNSGFYSGDIGLGIRFTF